MYVTCSTRGALDLEKYRIIGTTESNDFFSKVCSRDKIYFPSLPPPNSFLLQILTVNVSREEKFQKNIRGYKNTFFVGFFPPNDWAENVARLYSALTLVFRGTLYHYIGFLVPPQVLVPSFMSVYIKYTDYYLQ